MLGKKAVCTVAVKLLDEGTIGIITFVWKDSCVITYQQNSAYEEDGKGGWKLKKNAPHKVYAHSCKLADIKIVE